MSTYAHAAAASTIRIPGQRRVAEGGAPAAPGGGTLTVFTNLPLGRSPRRRWAAADAVSGASMWEGYLRTADRIRVVACGRRSAPATVDPPVQVDAYAVPYYAGPAQLARRFLPVVCAISRAVRDADQIVLQAPGPNSSIAAVVCRLTGRTYDVEFTDRALSAAQRAQVRWMVRGAAAARPVTTR